MSFGTVRDDTGQDIELTQSSFSSLLQRPDRSVRKVAFDAFYSEFSDHRYTLASALSNSVKSDVFLARARNYPSALEAVSYTHLDVYKRQDFSVAQEESLRIALEPWLKR